MTAETTIDFPPRTGGFAPSHAWDRNFFLTLVVLIWLPILSGFGLDMANHIQTNEAAYPLIIHVHAAVFVGWLLLLTTQIALIRVRKPALHRRLGMTGVALIPLMTVVGLAAAWIMHIRQYTPEAPHTAFFAIQLTNIAAFVPLAATALLWRGDSSAHKRLILLATLSLIPAGFARLWNYTIGDALGNAEWAFAVQLYLGTNLLILALGGYDLVTRKRLHPAYLAGTGWILVNEIASVMLYFSPAWRAFAPHLIGH
ncbi:MAG: hypothetical protein WDN69_14570 [Aliidongia sp.]